MKIHLENGKCMGHAQCYAVSPELFPLDEHGFSNLEPHEVPPGEEQTARDGVNACPERALVLDGD